MQSALSVCPEPGCNKLTRAGRCEGHRYQAPQRPTGPRMGGHRWDKASRRYRTEHPFCVLCLLRGDLSAAAAVDHIVPHNRDYDWFWDHANWQSICWAHHSVKTKQEESLVPYRPIDGRWVICGLPGTGKTTHARTIGCAYYDMDEQAAAMGLGTRSEREWTQAERERLSMERGRWIRQHAGEPMAVIVASTITAMKIAHGISGRVVHVTCDEDERQRRLADRL